MSQRGDNMSPKLLAMNLEKSIRRTAVDELVEFMAEHEPDSFSKGITRGSIQYLIDARRRQKDFSNYPIEASILDIEGEMMARSCNLNAQAAYLLGIDEGLRKPQEQLDVNERVVI